MNANYDAKGYYQVLEVSPNAPLSLIKQQYYSRAKFWHPDHNDNPDAVEIFQKISVAYNLLKDQKKRLQYDLLSLVYGAEDFPELDSLQIYKNQNGNDDAALRVLKQRRVTARLNGFCIKETKDICNFNEAKDMVLSTSVANWLKGWWGIKAFGENIKALKFNYAATSAADDDNLKLLLHNAIAYETNGQKDMAWIYAKQAEKLVVAGSRAQELLKTYVDILDFHPTRKIVLPRWSAQELKFRQLIMPMFFLSVVIVYFVFFMGKVGGIHLPEYQTNSYYSVVDMGGVKMADDQIESKIIKVDGGNDVSEYLYHLAVAVNIYYGPDERYDVLKEGLEGQTVRVIGFTPDRKWYKVIVDNGEAGYVKKNNLRKGVGNPIPLHSKVN